MKESDDPFFIESATNSLPKGMMADSSEIIDLSSDDNTKMVRGGRKSPTSALNDQLKKSMILSHQGFSNALVSMNNERKRANDREENIEKDNMKLRKINLNKEMNAHFLSLIGTIKNLKTELEKAENEDHAAMLKQVIEANEEEMKKVVEELKHSK